VSISLYYTHSWTGWKNLRHSQAVKSAAMQVSTGATPLLWIFTRYKFGGKKAGEKGH